MKVLLAVQSFCASIAAVCYAVDGESVATAIWALYSLLCNWQFSMEEK